MRVTLQNLPKLKLGDLLRRKKMTLKHFLHEFGITTYEGMLTRCQRMGVLPAEESEFKACFKPGLPEVNNPLEGVVVLEPLSEVTEQQSVQEDSDEKPMRNALVKLEDFSVVEFDARKQKKKKVDATLACEQR